MDNLDTLLTCALGLFVLFKRDTQHKILWLCVALYWIAGGIAQDIIGSNSIPFFDIPAALAVGYCGTYIARKSETLWPLLTASMMLLTAVNCAVFVVCAEVNAVTSDVNRLYQDISFLLFYAALITLLFNDPRTIDYDTRANNRLFT